MHLQKAYSYLGYKRGDFPLSEKACKEVIALPMFPELKPRVLETITKAIKSFF